MDIVIDVPAVPVQDLMSTRVVESSSAIAARVRQARDRQQARYRERAEGGNRAETESGASYQPVTTILTNAHVPMDLVLAPGELSDEARQLLEKAVEHFRLSARGYHRVLRLARTIADLDQQDGVAKAHIAEAIGYRQEHGFARSGRDYSRPSAGMPKPSSRLKDEGSGYAEGCAGD
jgi:magnesium chelatase family protein